MTSVPHTDMRAVVSCHSSLYKCVLLTNDLVVLQTYSFLKENAWYIEKI